MLALAYVTKFRYCEFNVYLKTCSCVYIHTSIRPYIHPYLHIHTHSRRHAIHGCSCVYIHTSIHPYIHTYIHISIHTVGDMLYMDVHVLTYHGPSKPSRVATSISVRQNITRKITCIHSYIHT